MRTTGMATRLLVAVMAGALLWPVAAMAAPLPGKKAQRAKITVHKPSGHGFLPGYRQPPDLTDWRVRNGGRYEPRYFDYYGRVQYGWGRPGFYRGRWNGGGFGPCWTPTPIGMMPNCGQ